MLSNWFGVFKEQEMKMKDPEEDENVIKAKSQNFNEFIKTPEAQAFVKEWSNKKDENGNLMYTKRGVIELLRNLYKVPGLWANKRVLLTAKDILVMLKGMDGLKGFLAGWKAKSEGIMKGIKGGLGSIIKKAA